jgi:hypothetical protein
MTTTLNASTAGAGGFIATGDNSGSLALQTAGTTAVTIDTSQNVAVGNTSPQAKLSVGAGTTAPGYGYTAKMLYVCDTTQPEVLIRETGGSVVTSMYSDASTGNLRTATNHPLVFSTNNSERMRIDSSGNLMVGGTGFTSKRLSSTVSSTSDVVIYAESTSASYAQAVYRSATSTSASTSWSHFIGQSSGSTNNIFIYGNGDIKNTNNSYGAISDIKLKENIIDATPKLADLMQVKVRNYNLKGDYEQHKQLGVIAQELEQVFPSMVEETIDRDTEGNDLGTTTKGVKYSVFVPMLIKAMQEQQAIITAQAETINALTARVAALEAK